MARLRAITAWAVLTILPIATQAIPSPSPGAFAAAFRESSRQHGVPESVLLAVSYAETRWDDHHGQRSTSGGYGPMHLTSVPETDNNINNTAASHRLRFHTLEKASELTGLDLNSLRNNAIANIAGGAALLAWYQREIGQQGGVDTSPSDWYKTVARYPTLEEDDDSFADDVFSIMANGVARTNNVGQYLSLSPVPIHRPPRSRLDLRQTSNPDLECPTDVGCEWLPAPYEDLGNGAFGNHDKGNRPLTGQIDYIIIHDTESSWQNTLSGVQNPAYISWQYTMRSSDGYIWQHVSSKDIAWHAGNWYVNMHSIGIEHEGYAAQGATWFTESLYRNSARLVQLLSQKHGIPLDRAHIIGHDQVPGINPASVAGMHWDPGPFWDWEHYFDLLGAPIPVNENAPISQGSIITIKPGFASNAQTVTNCNGTGNTCGSNLGTNFIYLRQAPSDTAALVKDVGLRPSGADSTTQVSDIGARLAAGSQWVVSQCSGEWVAVWYLGALGWFKNPAAKRVAFASPSSSGGQKVVKPKVGNSSVPVYGRAYPEQSAYPAEITYQTVVPLQYTIGQGQAYVIGDADIETDYYRTDTFNGLNSTNPLDHYQVKGTDVYYQIWFGHRMAYVRAADMDLI